MSTLKAVVVGAGWAGEGHARALQKCAVEVSSICGRDLRAVSAAATKLGIASSSIDWQQTLAVEKPDIVSIATPGDLRGDVVDAAIDIKAHLFCDKPLATNGADAERIYRRVKEAGVRDAFAATQYYDPYNALLRQLIDNGSIGKLRSVKVSLKTPNLALPWSWTSVLARGGGLLSNMGVHLFASIERILGTPILTARGVSRVTHTRAPKLEPCHDFRARIGQAFAFANDPPPDVEWGDCDADDAFTASLGVRHHSGDLDVTVEAGCSVEVTTTMFGGGAELTFAGERGTLIAEGFAPIRSVSLLNDSGRSPQQLPLSVQSARGEDSVQENWTSLARDFVADIRGEPHDDYLRFYDGWRYQVLADAIRASSA